MFSNIKVIVFDLYGTLLVFDDFDRANREWEDTFRNAITKKKFVDSLTVGTICKNILERIVKKDLSAGLTTYETKIRNEFEKHSVNISLDEIKQLADFSLEEWQKNIGVADDAIFVLEKLSSKFKIGLITNFDHARHPRKVLAATGLEKCFNKIWISDEEGCQKPDSEIFMKAINYFSIKAHEAVYVGDNIIDDVKGSLSAGMIPVLIDRKQKSNTNHHLEINPPHSAAENIHVINSLTDLLFL
jgi:HAD superfamily hydrolase (TIGR01549 family)